MRPLLLVLLLVAAAGASAQGASRPTPEGRGAERPNVVIVLADDLGWADTGAYGGTAIQTPNVDRLAAEGLRFTDAYASSPVCSPTRAALQTGLHPARLGMHDILNPHRRPWARLLPPAEPARAPGRRPDTSPRPSRRPATRRPSSGSGT